MNTEHAGRERAVQSPRLVGRVALEQLASTRCACGAPAVEIRRHDESVVGHCATHAPARPPSMSERQLRLSLVERELRQNKSGGTR
jgi:hypothetical protein